MYIICTYYVRMYILKYAEERFLMSLDCSEVKLCKNLKYIHKYVCIQT